MRLFSKVSKQMQRILKSGPYSNKPGGAKWGQQIKQQGGCTVPPKASSSKDFLANDAASLSEHHAFNILVSACLIQIKNVKELQKRLGYSLTPLSGLRG